MENDDELKLVKFKAAVFEEAEALKKEAEKKAIEEKNHLIEVAEDEILKKSYDKIQKQILDVKNNLRKEFADVKFQCKREILADRDNLKNQLFLRISKRIYDYTLTDDYKEKLIKNIQKLISKEKLTSYSIKISVKDESLIDSIKLTLGDNAQIIVDKTILIGGFIVVDKTRNVVFNETYDNALKTEEDRFCTYSGMNI